MLTISQLIQKINDKEYVLPDFQRGFVWNKTKVKKLIISLYKNYPTGNLLIWKTKQIIPTRGGENPNNSDVYTNFILDGQQRLTSIYKIITGEEPPFYEGRRLDLKLYFNIEDEEFSYWQPVKMRDDFKWINITDFFKTIKDGDQNNAGLFLADKVQSENQDEKSYYNNNLHKVLSVLNKLASLGSYNYYIDEDKLGPEMEFSEVVKIFNLVNKQGRNLSENDLAMAHITMVIPNIKDDFRKYIKRIKDKNFEFDFTFLTYCINAVANKRGKFDSIYKLSENEIGRAWETAKKCIEYLINIISTKGYIHSTSQDELRTFILLIPLVSYLSNNNNEFKNERDINMALYWLYNATIWGRYTRRGTSSPLEQDIVSINKENNIEVLIDNLKREVRNLKVKPIDLEGTPSNSPFFNMFFVVAKSKHAEDWFTGMELNSSLSGNIYKLNKHHIFPSDYLKKNGLVKSRADQEIANSLLNRAVLTQKANLRVSNNAPDIYLSEVMDKYSNSLNAQMVPTNRELWKLDNFNAFLSERSVLLANEINQFLDNLVNGHNRAIDYKEIIKEGEHQNLEFKETYSYDVNEGKEDKSIRFYVIKTIAGFLNSDGGTLMVGVADDGNVTGLDRDYSIGFKKDKDGFELNLRSYLEKYITDRIIRRYIEIKIIEIDNKEVLLLNIKKQSKFEPIFIKKEAQKILYVRKGNKTDPIVDVEEVNEYVEEMKESEER